MKKLFFLLAISSVILMGNYGCKNNVRKSDKTSANVTVDSFLKSPESWAGKEIVIAGTVTHVCRHSGKKLFLFSENPDNTVKIVTGSQVTSFNVELEGKEVEVKGKVIEDEKIDENYLKSWEEEIRKKIEDKEKKVCDADKKALKVQNTDTVKTKEADEDPYAGVKEYRKKLEESGKPYLTIYAIECISLKEVSKAEEK